VLLAQVLLAKFTGQQQMQLGCQAQSVSEVTTHVHMLHMSKRGICYGISVYGIGLAVFRSLALLALLAECVCVVCVVLQQQLPPDIISASNLFTQHVLRLMEGCGICSD
jgi:hypothetical protein